MTEKPSLLLPENMLPEITVAVCVRNGSSSIGACLESLIGLDYPFEKLHLIVVDNNSTDDTCEIIAKFPVTCIKEPKIGRGYARNAAWESCKTPFIAFTDADCRVSRDWLNQIAVILSDPTIGAAGGDIVTPGKDLLARFFEFRQIVSNREFSGDYPYSPPFLATANAVFRVEAIKRAGGFRTQFRVAEDADICWRIREQGWKIKYIPGAVVFHEHRTSRWMLFRQALDYGHDGVSVHLAFHPETRFWIWWGLYYRWFGALISIPLSAFKKDAWNRHLPLLDLIRYSGLSLGRIQAGVRTRRLIL